MHVRRLMFGLLIGMALIGSGWALAERPPAATPELDGVARVAPSSPGQVADVPALSQDTDTEAASASRVPRRGSSASASVAGSRPSSVAPDMAIAAPTEDATGKAVNEQVPPQDSAQNAARRPRIQVGDPSTSGLASRARRPLATPDMAVSGTPGADAPNMPGPGRAVGDVVNFDASLQSGADYLRRMQADITEDNAGNGDPDVPDDPDDGGWDWRVTSPPAPFSHTTGVSSTNLFGASAQGLYYAYVESANAANFTALTDAADAMVADPTIDSGADLKFLMLFNDLYSSVVAPTTVYSDAAKLKYDAKIASYGSATALAVYIRDVRGVTQGYPNGIIAWDIGIWAVDAQMLFDRFAGTYDIDADDIAEVIYQDSFLDNPGLFDIVDDAGWDPTYTDTNFYWYTLGLTGLIDAFDASGTHTVEIPGLVTRLLDSQYTGGGISFSYGANLDDEDWQSTAYAMITLGSYDQATYQQNINWMGYWTGATQDVSGGWVYSSGNHYPEVGGECTAGLSFTTNAVTDVLVDDDFTGQADVDAYNLANGTSYVWGYDAFATIQNGVDAVSGSTVNVAAGTYTGTVDIDARSAVNIVGADRDTVIFQPASTISWAIPGYPQYDGRLTAIRVVGSTNIAFSNMTMDFSLSKGAGGYPGVFGIFGWDSSVSVSNCVLENMSVDDASGGYYEITSYFRAPGLTDATRAAVAFTGNTFVDPGRVGITTHDYIHATITGNTFYKTTADFGYAMEVGSQSTGVVSGNTIYGYDTAALSDGSESAGIYVENAFTGGSPTVAKGVTVSGNEVYNCQYAMWIGNGYDGYAGDVDIDVTLTGNYFHDNVDGGLWIQDEDASGGSSVTVTGCGNTLTDNGLNGYYIYTQGDGDITVALSREVISGHDTGVRVEDTVGGSTYSVAINLSAISGNVTSGVNNTVAAVTVDGQDNWWGAATGPSGVGAGAGDAVSANVTFSPWLSSGFINAYAGGRRLASVQNNDGGWDWAVPDDGNPANASPLNTIGPIGRGLARAYELTGDPAMLTALQNVGGLLLTKANNFSPSDGYLAVTLDEILGGTAYTDHVNAGFYGPLAAGTYDRNGAGTLYSTATYIDLIQNARHGGGIGNLAAWDIGMGTVAAASAGVTGSELGDWIQGVKDEVDLLDGAGYYDVIGLAGAVYALAFTGEDFDPTGGEHAAASSLSDLADILVTYQLSTGGFTWNSYAVIEDDGNETIQESSYAVLALLEMNGYGSEVLAAVDYINSVQLCTGGWANYVGDGENNEVTAEALWGVALPVQNANTLELFPSIQTAIADPDTLAGDTIVVTTDIDEGPVIVDKSLTIQGGSVHTVTATTDTTASGDGRAWFLVNAGVVLDVQDLVFDGNGHQIYQAFRHKGGGSFTNCGFHDITFPGYAGVAIAAFGDGPVDFTGCTFDEIGRVGVLYWVAGTYSGCTYTGKGDGDWLDYALDMNAGAVVAIEDSTATDCRGVASSDGSTSAGYMATTLYGGGTTATITGCTITQNSTGIFSGYNSADTAIVTANNNAIFGNGPNTGIVMVGTVTVDAENNWWGDASGPFDPSDDAGETDELGVCTGTPEAEINADGTGDRVSDTSTSAVDYCPWATSLPRIELVPDMDCYDVAGNVTVDVWMYDITETIVGGQFFLDYDTSVLTFVSAVPGNDVDAGSPFETQLFELVDTGAGTIDYSVSDLFGGAGTTGDALMAQFTFTAATEVCGAFNTLDFRSHDPPTRLSDNVGGEVVPTLVNLPALVVDDTPPTIDVAATNLTVECDGAGNAAALNAWLASNGTTGAASDTCGNVTWSHDFTALSDDCGETGSATVTFTATDDCGNFATTMATFTIEDTTDPTVDTVASNMTVECDGAGNTAQFNAWLASAGGAVASDVCGGVTWSNDSTGLSDLCGGTGAETVIFTATDDCGNTSVTTTATFTVEDTTNPSIDTAASNMTVECDGAGNTAAFNAWLANNGGAVASDVCGGVTWSNDSTGLSDLCGATGAETVIFTATDDCGLTATTTATFTIEDTALPVLVGCPGDINVSADAGLCTADVTYAEPTATDDCGAASVVCDWPTGSTFPSGTTLVTCTATDECSNTDDCTFNVNVAATNELVVSVELEDTVAATFSRCITFEFWDCPDTGPAATVDEVITFTNQVGSTTLSVACGDYSCVTARDKLHTLRKTDDDDFGTVGTQYVADFTGTDALAAANLNDDFWVDVLDFGVLNSQWFVNYGSADTSCATGPPHADVDGSGIADNVEFIILVTNFFMGSEPNCCGAPATASADEGPVASISVKELRRRGLDDLAVGDLNGDGWLDEADVAAFAAGARPVQTKRDSDRDHDRSVPSSLDD